MEQCFPLLCIGDMHAEITYVEAQATKFMCAAYGKVAESCNSMTECRIKMWRSKTGKSGPSSVKLCSIPPTTEALTENMQDATIKWQYGRLHFLSHDQKWTQQSMAGSFTLMISRSRGGHIGNMFWKLLGALDPLAPLAMPMAIES